MLAEKKGMADVIRLIDAYSGAGMAGGPKAVGGTSMGAAAKIAAVAVHGRRPSNPKVAAAAGVAGQTPDATAAAARLGLRTARDANMSRDGLRSIPATVVVNQRLLEEARAAAPSMQDREATLYQS